MPAPTANIIVPIKKPSFSSFYFYCNPKINFLYGGNMQIYVVYSNSTINKFKDRQRQKYNANLELIAKHINANTELKKKAVFVLGSLLYANEVVSAADPLGKIDTAGNTILGIVRRIGYWCCIIGCIIDIIKALMNGDTKSIAKIMMKYALAFGALYIFPWILDLIKSIF